MGLDLRLLRAGDLHLTSIITAVSAQDRRGLRALEALPRRIIEAQFDALDDASVDAYRIGALASVEAIDIVAERLTGVKKPIVLDPVLGASGGGTFLDEPGVKRFLRRLLPVAGLVTPNLAEAAILSSGKLPIDRAGMAEAARRIRGLGARAVLVKGGHLSGEPYDVLDDGGGEVLVLSGRRLDIDMRGTGCLLAATIAANCARGQTLRTAVIDARAFVAETIADALFIGGMSVARGRD